MSIAPLLLGVFLAPLMKGIVNKTKAFFAGRQGPPLLQTYYDIIKLLRKGAVYSHTTSWVFRAGPIITLAATFAAAALVPFGSGDAIVAFPGDFVLFAYLLALGRFFTVAAALDTGSAFEGMGSSREVFFSALAEPALLLGLAAAARESLAKSTLLSLSAVEAQISVDLWSSAGLILAFVAGALFIVFLAENSRIPIDDPTTHLELTMIHEVMVLDHSGPDLAYILAASALRFWLLGALLVGIVLPTSDVAAVNLVLSLGGMAVLAVLVGVVESTMARLQMVRVPQLLVGAVALSVLALVLEHRLA